MACLAILPKWLGLGLYHNHPTNISYLAALGPPTTFVFCSDFWPFFFLLFVPCFADLWFVVRLFYPISGLLALIDIVAITMIRLIEYHVTLLACLLTNQLRETKWLISKNLEPCWHSAWRSSWNISKIIAQKVPEVLYKLCYAWSFVTRGHYWYSYNFENFIYCFLKAQMYSVHFIMSYFFFQFGCPNFCLLFFSFFKPVTDL